MRNDLRGKAVIITGGTKGIGLATGLSFGRVGAKVYLTHKWHSANEDEIFQKFDAIGALPPSIVEADVISDEETVRLMELIKQEHEAVEVFVSNVCIVQPAQGVESYRKRSLLKSLEYSAWPFAAYTQHIKKIFGRYPRYVVGISSDGPDQYFSNYEFVAASKTVMETLCRYIAKHLASEDIRLNVIRSRNVLTDAVFEIFGPQYVDFLGKYGGQEYFMQPHEVGDAVLALCSGFLDSMNGQVIQVDKGMAFADTLMRLLEKKAELGL